MSNAITVGRIVRFHPPPTQNEQRACAALVTNVHGDGTIDLRVFDRITDWNEYHVPMGMAEAPGTWTWPPRTP